MQVPRGHYGVHVQLQLRSWSCRSHLWPDSHFGLYHSRLPLRTLSLLIRHPDSRLLISSNTPRLPGMSSTVQNRLHSSHSHSHKHDSTYLTSANRKDAAVRITKIGLYVNFLMAIGKGIGGYLLNSQSLVADGFHSLTDLVSDFLTLATVAWSLKPPNERFPSGYGKIESLGSLSVSGLLLMGGIGLGWHSGELLYSQLFVDAAGAFADHSHNHDHSGNIFSHSHSHNPADMGIPNIHAAWIAGGSIVIKEYLYRASKLFRSCR